MLTTDGLVAPDKLADKSYNELVKVLWDHFDVQLSEIVERFKFHTWMESVTSFVAELRCLAKYYNSASLNDLLWDIVWGINDESIQRHLLLETAMKLTFDKVLDIATRMEAARTHIGKIQSGCSQLAEVHKVAAVAS